MPSSFEELRERLSYLEERTILVRDLPLAALKRKLESDWQPEASVLLGPASVSLEMLAGVARGSATLTWPGGTPESDILAVTHGLGRVPNIQVTATARVGAVPILVWTDTPTSTSVNVRARTIDGSNPAAAATANFDWRAEG